MRRIVPVLLVVLALAGCERTPTGRDLRFHAFGTVIEATVYGLERSEADAAGDALGERLQRWHRAWQPWNGDGLARINRALAAGRSAAVSPELAKLLRRGRRLAARSGGHFNPGLGALTRLWGFDQAADLPSRPPADAAIQRLVAQAPGLGELRLREGHAASDNPALQIDLGGFAKGVAVARGLTGLRRRGAEAALLSAGGDIATFGQPGDRPWRIGIRAPRGEGLLAAVTLQAGEAVFTSGDYARFFEHGGRRYHHLLDPATGYPARGTRAVTVIADDPALADAAATALFVAGPGQWPALARALGVARVMLVDADGGVHMSEAMRERLEFEREPAPPVAEVTRL